MSELRKIVKNRLDELGRNPFDAARIGGLNKHFIDDLLIGKKHTVKETSLGKLAAALDWTRDELMRAGEDFSSEIYYDADVETARSAEDAAARRKFYDREGVRINANERAILEIDVAAGLGGGQIPYQTFGAGSEVADAYKREQWVLPESFISSKFKSSPKQIVAASTRGDSMSPTISNGDIVFIDTAHRKISPSGIYAIRNVYGEITVKRLDAFRRGDDLFVKISSDNQSESPHEERLSEVHVVGRVCGILKTV
jgi:hypothetical protein